MLMAPMLARENVDEECILGVEFNLRRTRLRIIQIAGAFQICFGVQPLDLHVKDVHLRLQLHEHASTFSTVQV